MAVRLIGVIEAEQTEEGETEENDRLLGVAIHSHQHQNLKSIDEVSAPILDQVDEFFVTYNRERGKKFKVKKRRGPKRAAQALEAGMKMFRRKKR